MKKLITIVLISIFLVGCDVEYKLTIDDNSFSEDVNFKIPNTDRFKPTIKHLETTNQPIYLVEKTSKYYNLDIKEKGNNYHINYKHDFDKSDILYSNAINQCYRYANLDTTGDYLELSTSPTFTCLFRDTEQIIKKATIKIITPLKVKKHNADFVKKNTYIWNIDETNYKDKPIEIKMEKTKQVDKNKHLLIIGVIILVGIVLIALIAFMIIKRKHVRKNEI